MLELKMVSAPSRSSFPPPAPAASGGRTCCVVLRPANGSTAATGDSGSLSPWLARRGFKALDVNDPLTAMAAICLIERSQASRSAWGLPRVEPLGLVVVEPARWTDVESLLSAVQRFVPDAGIWRADGDEPTIIRQPGIAPAARDSVSAPQSAPAALDWPAAPSEHADTTEPIDEELLRDADEMTRTLRIARPGPTAPQPIARNAKPAPAPATAPSQDDAEPLRDHDAPDDAEPARITRDELAMLLDDHFDSSESDAP